MILLAGGADLGAHPLSILPPRVLVLLYKEWADWSPTARNIPPAQPSARQDAVFPERGPSEAARSANKGD
jgi:hypothetical protein